MSSLARKTTKKSQFANIDAGLKNFIANCNNSGVPINDLAREKALAVVTQTGQNLKVSNGYNICKSLKQGINCRFKLSMMMQIQLVLRLLKVGEYNLVHVN